MVRTWIRKLSFFISTELTARENGRGTLFFFFIVVSFRQCCTLLLSFAVARIWLLFPYGGIIFQLIPPSAAKLCGLALSSCFSIRLISVPSFLASPQETAAGHLSHHLLLSATKAFSLLKNLYLFFFKGTWVTLNFGPVVMEPKFNAWGSD